MRERGLLREIFPHSVELGRSDLKRLGNLVQLMPASKAAADPILRLTALVLLFPKDAVRELAASWRLSNADRDRMVALSGVYAMPENEIAAKRELYQKGEALYRDQLLLTHAAIPHAVGDWQSHFDLPRRWNAPRFALDGGDVMKLGIAQGPRVGELLSRVERWWMENGFAATRDQLLERLKFEASRT
jgi:poly(A) polymerase